MNFKIEVNGAVLTDTYLTDADTFFLKYFNWDSGYYNIIISAENSSGTRQIENIRILRNAEVEIFDTVLNDTFLISSDSHTVNLLVSETVDSNYIHIVFNDSDNYTGAANLILQPVFDDTKIISITKDADYIDSMPSLENFAYCTNSLLLVNYGLAGETSIFAADSAHIFYVDLFFDVPNIESSLFKIFVFYPAIDSGYFVNAEIVNGRLTGVIPVDFDFYIAVVKPQNNALNALGDDIAVYPNPWKPNDNNIATGNYSTGVYIRNLKINDSLKIYSFSGELIFSHNIARSDNDYFNWNCRTNKNSIISSGVYFITVKRSDSGRTIIKKFMAVR